MNTSTKSLITAAVASLAIAGPASAQVDVSAEAAGQQVSHSDNGVEVTVAGTTIKSSQHGIQLGDAVQADARGVRASLLRGAAGATVRTGSEHRTQSARSTTRARTHRTSSRVQRVRSKAKVSARAKVL